MTTSNTLGLFDQLCSGRLEKAVAVCKERGGQYGDTLKDCQWLVVIASAKKLGIDLNREQARAIAIAGLVDVKYQRFQGGYKEDHIDDGINYASVLPGVIELALNKAQEVESEHPYPADFLLADGRPAPLSRRVTWDDAWPLWGSVDGNPEPKYGMDLSGDNRFRLYERCPGYIKAIKSFLTIDEAKAHAEQLEANKQ